MLTREGCKVRHITAEKYFASRSARRFTGGISSRLLPRIWLSGVPPAKLGPRIENQLRLTFERPTRTARRGWTGAILHVDHFGNIVTNIPVADFPQIEQQPFEVTVGFRTVEKLARSYAEMPPGELFAIVGSSGYLEISANQQSAARLVGCETGAPVEIRLF